jgi:hypothetical protein
MTTLLKPKDEKRVALATPPNGLWTPAERELIRQNAVTESKIVGPEHLHTGDVVVHAPLPAKLEAMTPVEWALRRQGIMPVRGAAADAWQFTNYSRTDLLDGTQDIDTDTFKMALFLSTSNLADTVETFAALTNEHAAANGYTAGGEATALSITGDPGATITVDCTDEVWTASGGSIVARFVVIYEVAGNTLVWTTLDNTPADVTATDGNTLTVAINASGVFTLSGA